MRELSFILILILVCLMLGAQNFEINKIEEIAYAQSFNGAESIQIVDDILYFNSMNGLEIYQINNDGSLTNLSILPIPQSGSLIVKDQYCFLVSGDYDSINMIPVFHIVIYKINISDAYNPFIDNQIEYENLDYYGSMNEFGNYLIFKWFDAVGFHHDFYSLPELEFVGQVNTQSHHNIVNDNLLVRQDGLIFYIEQYIPPSEYEVIGIIDISAYSDGNYPFDHFKVVNDTLLSAVNYRNITFWDISDETNWQYISRYTLPENFPLSGNKQYSIMGENAVIFDSSLLRLLDISDISNPVLVDSIEHNMYLWGQTCDFFNNNLYVGTLNDGIQQYNIQNNLVEYIDSYFDHKRFFISDMYEDKIISSIITDGYYLFDVGDPLNTIDLGEQFNGKDFNLLHEQGGWMLIRNPENYCIEIYDITELGNPILINTLQLNSFDYVWSRYTIDQNNPEIFYRCNFGNDVLTKYDISEQGNPVELFEYDLVTDHCALSVRNSIAYVTYGSSPFNLQVIDGLEDNDPFIANEINNFSENSNLMCHEDFLIVWDYASFSSVAKIYLLNDPITPELYFTPQWGDWIKICDDLIFSISDYIVCVYENKPNSTEPIAIFNGLNYIYNINLIEHEGINYLITNEMANIGLFEYTYVPSSAEDELPKAEITLSNYPNPFNPETTISFSVTQNSDFVSLEIYNIKGQKVKKLEITNVELGINEVIWNGTDENNKPVSSGVYMYQLKVDGKAIANKKCLLLK